MPAPTSSTTLSITIHRDAEAVYEFIRDPANLPAWAAGLGQAVVRTDQGWVVKTPAGEAGLRFVGRNDFRVCDHYVTLPSGEEIHVPMRVLDNGDGSEVIFTLFWRTMTEDELVRDATAVARDLQTLKAVLERRTYL